MVDLADKVIVVAIGATGIGAETAVSWWRPGRRCWWAISTRTGAAVPSRPSAMGPLERGRPPTRGAGPGHRPRLHERRDLTGFFFTARHALPHLLDAGGGPIVVTNSAAAFLGDRTRPAYSTSKTGLGALVRHIASRWGKQGIRSNAVAPGLVLSDEMRSRVPAERQEGWLSSHLAGRLGPPRDVAGTAAFLLSDQAEWITGQIIGVDGGMVLR